MNDRSDLLRDPDDLAEVLEAHGQKVPDDPESRRRRALELFEEIPTVELLAIFAQHATGFMRMVQDIDGFCQSVGATVGGRIQIHAGGQPLQFNGLCSGWVFDGPSDWESAEQRALALAEELRYLSEEFDPNRATGSRQTLTAFGRSLQGTIYANLNLGGSRRRETTVRAVDLDQLKRIQNDLESTRLSLQNTDVPPAVASALDLAAFNLDATHKALNRHVHESGGQPSETLTALHNSIGVLLSQLARLVAEVNVGRRASQERSDFLRTEFWKQRWRVYELWLLMRVLSALRDAGAVVSLNGVQDGVWNLRYGRSEVPVATCNMGETPINVYYQLHVQSDDGADMPDIAVIGGQPIVVLDPKHGRSYTRGKVQRVLTRYAASFSAALTAIVNYYPARSYGFEVTSHGDKRWLLASGIAPGSAGVQRLELLIRDAMLATGHVAHSAANAAPSTSTFPRHRASTQAFIVFCTNREVEVDEPRGFWSVRAGRGPEWLSAFERITGNLDRAYFTSVEIRASPSEDHWLVKVADERKEAVVWRLSEGNPPTIVNSDLFEKQTYSETSPSGRYNIHRGPQSMREGVLLLQVLDTRGDTSFPLIRCYGRHAHDYLWAPDESSVAFRVSQGDERRLMVARLGDRHATPVSLPGQMPKAFGWMTPALLRSVTPSD